jgi:L-fuculose-phosphate aldolase
MQPMSNQFQIRQEMCEIGHRIWMRGFCAGNEGNHSVRIADDRVLSTPTGVSKGFITPDQVCVVDMDGNQIDKHNKMKRTSEVLLHLAIYKARPDVRAVIHSHPAHATAFAMTNVPIPEGIHPEAEVFLGKVPTTKYTTPGYKEVGESVVALIKADTNTVMMGNHGSVCFDTSLIQAYYKLEILDNYCRILLLARQLGKINPLTQDEIVELLKVKENFGMKDTRLACAAQGCVGKDNDAFLASFDVRPKSACSCHEDGRVEPHAAAVDENQLEEMVQQVTDKIMAGMKT